LELRDELRVNEDTKLDHVRSEILKKKLQLLESKHEKFKARCKSFTTELDNFTILVRNTLEGSEMKKRVLNGKQVGTLLSSQLQEECSDLKLAAAILGVCLQSAPCLEKGKECKDKSSGCRH
jgi:hypothetical protein